MAQSDLIDVLRGDPCLDDQSIAAARHDKHDRFACVDDPANRVHSKLMHRSGLWCTDVYPLQLIFRGDTAFVQLSLLGLDLAHVFDHLGLEILIELDDLQLGLGNFSLRLGGGGRQLAPLTLEARHLALRRRVLGDGYQFLHPKLVLALQLDLHELQLFDLRLLLRGETTNLLFELGDAFAQLSFLSGTRHPAAFEQRGTQLPDSNYAPLGATRIRSLFRLTDLRFLRVTTRMCSSYGKPKAESSCAPSRGTPIEPALTPLKLAINDVKTLARNLKLVAEAGGYAKAEIIERVEVDATKERIASAFTEIASRIERQDALIVLLAGHGKSNAGRYYYLPINTRFGGGRNLTTEGIPAETWQQWIASVQVDKKLLIIDTCESSDAVVLVRGMWRESHAADN